MRRVVLLRARRHVTLKFAMNDPALYGTVREVVRVAHHSAAHSEHGTPDTSIRSRVVALPAAGGRSGGAWRARSSGWHDVRAALPALAAWEPEGTDEEEKLAAMEAIADRMVDDMPATGDNPHLPAGYTYLGQFIAHDLTFDAGSSLTSRQDARERKNFRSASLDLDCLYGTGPEDQPFLYSTKDPRKFVLGSNENFEEELPRNRDDSLDSGLTRKMLSRRRPALIGDPRNDENVITAQLHLQMLRFHNHRVDQGSSFEEARRLTCWHYQWAVVHDFLKRLCGDTLVDDVLGVHGTPDLVVFDPTLRRIPIEFSAAVFRFGHSMVRRSYHLSDALAQVAPCFVPFGEFADKGNSLDGGRELPPNWTIQWDRFFEVQGSRPPQSSRLIDTKLSSGLSLVPIVNEQARYRKLALRTLVRSWALRLPAGQEVAAGSARRSSTATPGTRSGCTSSRRRRSKSRAAASDRRVRGSWQRC